MILTSKEKSKGESEMKTKEKRKEEIKELSDPKKMEFRHSRRESALSVSTRGRFCQKCRRLGGS